MTRSRKAHFESMRMAFSGLVVALSVVLMLTSSLLAVMTYAVPLLCGILLLPVILLFGEKTAWITWLATTLLVLILGFDKELALFYLCFGFYPVIKPHLEKNRSRGVAMFLKAGLFLLLLALMYVVLVHVLHLTAVLSDFEEMGRIMTIVFFFCMMLCLMLYDHLLGPLSRIYMRKYHSKVLRLLRL